MPQLMIDPAAAREHIQSNWPNDPLLRTIGLNLVDTLPKEEVERVRRKEGCGFCVSGEPFETHIYGKAEIVRLVPLPAIDLTTGETEQTAEKPFFAVLIRSDDFGEDYVPIEFCPNCGAKMDRERAE